MINTRKSLSLLGVTVWMLFGANITHAQIPVTDGASISQQVAAQIETIAKWKLQVSVYLSALLPDGQR